MKAELERRGHLYVGLILAALAAGLGPIFFRAAAAENWKIETLYSAVFDLSSIAAAFLFAFYTFAKTTDSEFITKVRRTATFRTFMDYLVIAVVIAAAVAVFSVPMMILTPSPQTYFTGHYILFTVWAFFVGVAVGSTWRSTRQFVTLTLTDGDASKT